VVVHETGSEQRLDVLDALLVAILEAELRETRFSRLFWMAMTLRPEAAVKKIMWCAPASAVMSFPEETSSGRLESR
jgi:hypothetical protein